MVWFQTQRWARSGHSSDNKRGGSPTNAPWGHQPGYPTVLPATKARTPVKIPGRRAAPQPLYLFPENGNRGNSSRRAPQGALLATKTRCAVRSPSSSPSSLSRWIAVFSIILILRQGGGFALVAGNGGGRFRFQFPALLVFRGVLCVPFGLLRNPDHTHAGLPYLSRIRTERL